MQIDLEGAGPADEMEAGNVCSEMPAQVWLLVVVEKNAELIGHDYYGTGSDCCSEEVGFALVEEGAEKRNS